MIQLSLVFSFLYYQLNRMLPFQMLNILFLYPNTFYYVDFIFICQLKNYLVHIDYMHLVLSQGYLWFRNTFRKQFHSKVNLKYLCYISFKKVCFFPIIKYKRCNGQNLVFLTFQDFKCMSAMFVLANP